MTELKQEKELDVIDLDKFVKEVGGDGPLDWKFVLELLVDMIQTVDDARGKMTLALKNGNNTV
jgi:hypothetical protein